MSEESQNDGSKKSPSLAASNEACLPEECGAQVDDTTDTSHTNSSQMTASSVPPDGNKWTCELCTYENFPLSRKCTMCRTPKPSLGEDIFKLQDGATALPTQDVCGAEEVAERLKPLRISSPQGQASASSVTKWPCSTCTYENWPRASKCAMCGAAPPAPAAPAAPAAVPAAPAAPAARTPPVGINDVCKSPSPPAEREAEGARRSKRRQLDWMWLQACLGVVEGDARAVQAYLAAGGDPARALAAPELAALDRASAFDAGHTLVHLAIRFQRQEILSMLLSRISGGGPGLKRSPSYVAPDLAASIRRHIAASLRYRKGGSFPCHYINEFCTFSLPAEIEELPAAIQEQLFSEVLDREAQQTLEAEPALALSEALGARLLALWNRSCGDCLPDALCQAAYGVADRGNALRGALAAALRAPALRARWAAWERLQAARLHYAPEEAQLRAEWARLAAAAARPGAALRPLHVFALAHVLRRPVLVYGVHVVTSFRGEALGYAGFQGIYLPLLWEPEFCSASPLCLGYTRGHFCALVPLEQYSQRHDYICREQTEDGDDTTYLPLTDAEGKLLPVHFLTCEELEEEEAVVRRWVCARAFGGALAAARRPHARPLLQAQMLEEWLNHYRRLAQQTRGPFPPRLRAHADYSSDADTDDD